MIATTYRYEWRAVSYALFLHEDYRRSTSSPAGDDGMEAHTVLTLSYPEYLSRWKPLYKWFLAIPHYLVMAVLTVGAFFAVFGGLIGVFVHGEYRGPHATSSSVSTATACACRPIPGCSRPIPAVRPGCVTAPRKPPTAGSAS